MARVVIVHWGVHTTASTMGVVRLIFISVVVCVSRVRRRVRCVIVMAMVPPVGVPTITTRSNHWGECVCVAMGWCIDGISGREGFGGFTKDHGATTGVIIHITVAGNGIVVRVTMVLF